MKPNWMSLPAIPPRVSTEQPEKRPACGYKVGPPLDRKPCGREDGLFEVKGKGSWGKPLTTPVCDKHIEKAWKEWKVDSAERPDCSGIKK